MKHRPRQEDPMYIVLRTGKAILLLMLAAGPVSAASFDCAKAKRPEES